MSEKAILFDSSKCTACKGCQVACKCWNNLPSPTELNACAKEFTGTYQNPADINDTTRLIITFNEVENPDFAAGDFSAPLATKPIKWAFGRRACQHCTNAPCVEICPAGALYKDPDTGLTTYDQSKCVGCQYCSSVCPFDVPRYDKIPGSTDPVLNKCTGCTDRIANGMEPACVTTCQPDALLFGDRDELLAQAKERVEWLHDKGYEDAMLYGEDEMGGLHVLQILKYGVEAHGQVAEPKSSGVTAARGIAKPVTGVVSGLVFLGLAGMTALAAGSEKHTQVTYNPATGDTLDMETGEVLKQGDGQGTKTWKEYMSQVPVFKKWGEDSNE